MVAAQTLDAEDRVRRRVGARGVVHGLAGIPIANTVIENLHRDVGPGAVSVLTFDLDETTDGPRAWFEREAVVMV